MKERDFFTKEVTSGGLHSLDGEVHSGARRTLCIERSSLWAAYGDALGWISELADQAGLMRRTGGAALSQPVAWQRRIGGRSGVTVLLPAGCYSDDSQLRLATSRAIRVDGFDVEAFSKVELPVWLSYGLGGGKSTSVASEHLGRTKSTWWNNKFRGWTQSGGNGAAMRVQPHVWASPSPAEPESYLPAVVRNTVCTHSHPNGLLGAVLHALCLAHAIHSGNLPSQDELPAIIQIAEELPDIIASDTELGFWRVAFEQEVGSFSAAWTHAVSNLREAADLARTCHARGSDGYAAVVNALNLRDAATRGSGVLTALAAVALGWCEPNPTSAMRIAANALGTDTDTIATMAGAMLGAAAESDPPIEVLDATLFRNEARRLAKVAAGADTPNHIYPDLLHWAAPKTRADALTQTEDGVLVVAGLGHAHRLDSDPAVGAGGFLWQWVKLEWGQTLLIKSRGHIPETSTKSVSTLRPDEAQRLPNRPRKGRGKSPRSFPDLQRPIARTSSQASTHTIQEVISYMERHIDDDKQVGRTLRRVVEKGTPADIAAFTAALVNMLGVQTQPRELQGRD